VHRKILKNEFADYCDLKAAALGISMDYVSGKIEGYTVEESRDRIGKRLPLRAIVKFASSNSIWCDTYGIELTINK